MTAKLRAIIILCVIAVINAGYLVYKRYCIAFLTPTQSFCDINATYSCSNVLAHPAAMIGPLPFPAVAMLVYPILGVIAFLGWKGYITRHRKALTIMSIMGFVFNSYFMYQEIFIIKAFCPLCLICSGIIVTITILSAQGRKKSTLRVS